MSHCGKSLAAAQVSEVRAVRLGCSPGPTSLPAFQEITAGTEKQLPLPWLSVPHYTHTHIEGENASGLKQLFAPTNSSKCLRVHIDGDLWGKKAR